MGCTGKFADLHASWEPCPDRRSPSMYAILLTLRSINVPLAWTLKDPKVSQAGSAWAGPYRQVVSILI